MRFAARLTSAITLCVAAGVPNADAQQSDNDGGNDPETAIPSVILEGPIRITRVESGALLADDFEGDTIDLERWRVWQMDTENTALAVEDGRFVIDAQGELGHNGLWSLPSAKYKDVALVARFDMESEGPGSHELLLHLCGGDMPRSPDHWVEIAHHGQSDEPSQFSVYAATAIGGFNQWDRSIELPRPTDSRQDREDEGFLAKISLNGSTNLCVPEVRDAFGEWHAIVDPVPLHLRTTHCEIKIRGGATTSRSRGWFDDVRIYPRAESHAVLIHLQREDGSGIYHRGESGNEWPPTIRIAGHPERKLEDLSVELWTADGQTKVAAVQSPNLGDYMLPLTEAPWDVYPVAALIRISLDGELLGEVKIDCHGLDGLYPDDVYSVTLQ